MSLPGPASPVVLSLAGVFEGEFSNITRSYAGKGVVRYTW